MPAQVQAGARRYGSPGHAELSGCRVTRTTTRLLPAALTATALGAHGLLHAKARHAAGSSNKTGEGRSIGIKQRRERRHAGAPCQGRVASVWLLVRLHVHLQAFLSAFLPVCPPINPRQLTWSA